MLRYQLTSNQWKDLMSTLDETNVDDIANKFCTQIKLDQNKLEQNKDVSDCAFNAPRMGSKPDQDLKIAHKIAFMMFPLDDNEEKPVEVRKKWSYIRYQQLVSKLTKQFKKQLEDEEEKRRNWKDIRKTGMRKNFCSLKKKPVSHLVTDPVPMPVEVAPLEELEPFFNYLKENKQVVDKDHIQFQRGVHYDDGRIDLCKQVVGSPWIGHLMNSIKDNPYVDHFLLGNNIIDFTGAEAIAKFIRDPHVPKIKTWYLAGNRIDSEGMKLISQALKDDTDADALWLKRNPLKIEGVRSIGDMLEFNNTLVTLDLHNVGMMDEGCKYLFDGLRENSSVKLLYMDANGITSTGARYIANYFNYLTLTGSYGLNSLWIEMNRLDDEGVTLIAESLENYPHMERLAIGSNMMGPESAKTLFFSLMDHPKLTYLGLGCYKSTSDLGALPNNIGDEGAVFAGEFIRNNKTINILDISTNGMTDVGLRIIAEAMQENDSILMLQYSQWGIKPNKEIKQMIHRKLEHNVQCRYGMNFDTFMKDQHCRFLKHTESVKYIDSVYRNNM